jgi:hypothetical protein
MLFRDPVLISGQMDVNMKVIGARTNFMGKAHIHGQMAVNMMDFMKMIRKRDSESINGQMEEFTKDIGTMVNSMAKEN